MFGKDRQASVSVDEFLQLNAKFHELTKSFSHHLSQCGATVGPDTVADLQEIRMQLRTDYSAFAENLGRRMSSMETIQRELLSKTYEYDRILHALGVKITARAEGGQRVAPLAPDKGENVS